MGRMTDVWDLDLDPATMDELLEAGQLWCACGGMVATRDCVENEHTIEIRGAR